MKHTVTVPAYAKINPSLDVTGRRPDGYHEVRMLLQQITLCDVIRLEKAPEPGVRLRMIYDAAAGNAAAAEASALEPLPVDSTNLACRAAQLLIDNCDIAGGVEITLKKNIPVAAGLAGGSTDAAAVLKGMNALYDLGLSEEMLCAYGLTLGADIPFCIPGGGALAEGIGEKLTPLPPMPDCSILLVKPPEGVSTRAVYRALDAVPDPVHPDIDAALAAYAAGDLTALCACMGNILESVTLPMLPRLETIRQALLHAGALGAMMSGSGPTMFGLFDDASTVALAEGILRNRFPDCRVILTEPV